MPIGNGSVNIHFLLKQETSTSTYMSVFKDFEFIRYTKDPSITEIRNNTLTITPIIQNDEDILRQPMDLRSH